MRALRNLNILNIAVRYNPVYVRRVQRCSHSYDVADTPERSLIRARLLERSLRWAGQTKYGREYSGDLKLWPILEKDQVRRAPTDFLRQRFLRIGAGTGGTTGTPLQLYRSFENIAVERFFIEKLLSEQQLDLRTTRIAVLRADEVKDPGDLSPPFGVYRNRGRTLVLSNPHLNRTNLPWFAKELMKFKPFVLYVYPSMLENLLQLLEESGKQLQVPFVLSSSETVNATLFDRVSDQLGGMLIDYYGQAERVAFAAAASKDQYYFNPLYGYVELIPADDDAGKSGQRLYRLIAGGHWNSAMPLVRYDTGDLAMVSSKDADKLDRIAIGEIPFLGIRGRNSEFLVGPDGEVVSGLNHLPRNVPHLLRMQIVQESRYVAFVRVLVEERFSSSDEDVLWKNAKMLLPSEMRVEIHKTNSLERNRNGKIPFVIRRLTE